jgi:hypothetical protein
VADPDGVVGAFEVLVQPTIDAPNAAAAVTPATVFREMLIVSSFEPGVVSNPNP